MNDNNSNELDKILVNLEKLEVERRKNKTGFDRENWWNMAINADQLRVLVETAIGAALRSQKQTFDKQIEELNKKFSDIVVRTPEVVPYKDVEIRTGIQCDESLEIVKSLPEFDGKQECYVSWRQAAQTAYKIFEDYEGSSKHYQAVAIIRNKIKGTVVMTLASFNTALNFRAIIDRLDFTYSDKRPVHLIEQELSTLRQGNMTILQFYGEVEKKLTLLVNKTIMTYDRDVAASINEKYRADALRVFISGTKKSLSDVLFSARPDDLPSALALAQEVESNHERYLFATNYARSMEDKERLRSGQGQHVRPHIGKNPYFSRRQNFGNSGQHGQMEVQPMNIDHSSRFRQPTGIRADTAHYPAPSRSQHYFNRVSMPQRQGLGQAVKRPNEESMKFTGVKHQRINHLAQEGLSPGLTQEEYQAAAKIEASDIDEGDRFNEINFLGKTPCSHS